MLHVPEEGIGWHWAVGKPHVDGEALGSPMLMVKLWEAAAALVMALCWIFLTLSQ